MTYQTQQLTTEFEKQSQYIVCLLAELQQKDSAFLSLEAQLQHCKQEFELFRSQREKEENNTTHDEDGQQKLMAQEESSLESSGLHSEQEQGPLTDERDRATPVSDAEASRSDDQRARTGKVDQRSHDGDEVEFSQALEADLAAGLPALQQDQQLLQKEASALKHPDRVQNHSPLSAALPCRAEPGSAPRPRDVTAEDDLQIERSCDKERGDLERMDEGIEGALKAACEPEINHLQEQVRHRSPRVKGFPLLRPAYVVL